MANYAISSRGPSLACVEEMLEMVVVDMDTRDRSAFFVNSCEVGKTQVIFQLATN